MTTPDSGEGMKRERLIECVMNVSEGRDQSVIDAIACAIAASAETALLDVSSDADHNRSVLSFVSSPQAIDLPVTAAVDAALERIDLRHHRGVHPRIGAVDVIPLVPLGEVTLNECVTAARRLGPKLAGRFQLPVYLYAAAARGDAGRTLARIRRGEFEEMSRSMAGRIPDFGPSRVHPSAGSVALGARGPLIAFNLYLDTDILGTAREIAQRIRETGGGLRGVQALGFPIPARSKVQVSMNLLDYTVTRPIRVYHEVERLAQSLGIRVLDSELVGLIPAAAIEPGEAHEMRLKDFGHHRILEERIERALSGQDPF